MKRKVPKRVWVIGGLIILLLVAARIAMALASRSVAAGIGEDGRLAACPDRPNCVCSSDTDPQHAIDALPLFGHSDDAIDRLKRCLAEISGVSLVQSDARYLHATCVTPLLRFTDDLEFLVDENAGLIHVRSASRDGYSDLGVNRKRVEDLRRRWADMNRP